MARYTMEKESDTMYRIASNGKRVGSIRNFDGSWVVTEKGEAKAIGSSPRSAFSKYMDGLRDANAIKAGFENWADWVKASNQQIREDNKLFMEFLIPVLQSLGYNSVTDFINRAR